MSNAMSNYLASRVLNLLLRNETYTPTETTYLYVGLATSGALLEGDDTSEEVVLNGTNNYQRVAINLTTTPCFSQSSNGSTVSNSVDIDWPTATGTSPTDDWGTITHAFLADTSTPGTGHVLFWGALTVSKPVVVGDQFSILAGKFQLQLT